MTFVLPGQTTKLEVVQGIANTVKYWPRVDGKLVTATNPSITGLFDAANQQITGAGAASAGGDGSIQFIWTPAASLYLAEDYRFEVSYTDGTVPRTDRTYFDLVKVKLECPVDDNLLQAVEPNVMKWLAGQGLTSSQQFIQRAWGQIVQRIRGQGYRPALITDRFAFTDSCVSLSLSFICKAQQREDGDVFDKKSAFWAEQYARDWAAIGAIKFEDPLQLGWPIGRRTPGQPKFKY